MSKKETEYDRMDRMRKMEREAEATKKKNAETVEVKKKKSGKPKMEEGLSGRNWSKEVAFALEEEYDYV